MKITFKIRRLNKEIGGRPYFQEFNIEAEPNDRVLDALMFVKTNLDGSLAFRKSCAHGVCGSDAMVINGVERLACKTLIKEITDDANFVITVEPLQGMLVQKDLMVSQDTFFENYRAVMPFLINDEPTDGKERIQSPEERVVFDDTTNCILCAACYSSCPVIQKKNPAFIGPAAVVNAARFIFDSRDQGLEKRLPALDNPNGVWPCKNHFNCTRVCPRGIKVTKNINLTKRKIIDYKKQNEKL